MLIRYIDDLDRNDDNLFRVLALGNFDGLHRGHQHLLRYTAQTALKFGLRPTALIFEPHPQEVLRPGTPFYLLTLPEQRAQVMASLGIDELLIASFDERLSGLTPRQFVEKIIINLCHAKAVCVGADYHFGKDGKGNVSLLKRLGYECNVHVEEMPLLKDKDIVVSSSIVRSALLNGNLEKANYLLGYPFTMVGEVVHGQSLGRTMGFPTANLEIDKRCLLPRKGVYFGEALYGEETYFCLVNIGNKPTFTNMQETTIEAHLLDFEGDLYGSKLALKLRQYLRPELFFTSSDLLQEQLSKDLEQARGMINK